MEFSQSCHFGIPSETGCKSDEYQCHKTKVCILKEKECDLSDDCGEGEDEEWQKCIAYNSLTLENDAWLSWFSQDTVGDDLDWVMGSGSTETRGTGPSFDHTTSDASGHYLYLEGNKPEGMGRIARLISYTLVSSPSCTFTFYSHMYGRNIGSLRVLVSNGTSGLTPVLNLDGNEGNYWMKQIVNLELMPQDEAFKLILEGELGDGELGDIAVDDFVFSPNCRLTNHTERNCTSLEHRCSDGTCLPFTSRCNFVVECPSGDNSDELGCVPEKCTFEGHDSCNWNISHSIQEKEDVFTWILVRGDDPADNEEQETFKPKFDHTNGDSSGYYIFTSASQGEYKHSTDLIPELAIGESSITCRLRVWYWLSGPQPGSLHVQVISSSDEVTEAWMVDGNHGDKWNVVEVPLSHLYNQKVSVHAQRGTSYVGATAVDDVEFVGCTPPIKPPEGMTCAEMDKDECKSGACISKDLVCDNSNDCFDLSDESATFCLLYKYRCNFEEGICADWSQDADSTANWVVHKASPDYVGSLPDTDHTSATIDGHFMKLDGSSGSVSYLHSPVLQGTSKDCFFRMWYQVLGDVPDIIRIYKRYSYYEGGLQLLTQIDGSVQGVWIRSNLKLSDANATERHQVVIEGMVVQEATGHVVLDDFSMTPLCESSPDQKLPGEDELTTPSPQCPPGQLLCDNGNCYNPIESCNFDNDCGDWTDEKECTKSCDFEGDDWCGWFESSSSSIHWAISGFPAPPLGPDSDHSQSSTTHDLTTTKNEGNGGQVGILESYTFSTVGPHCSLTFWSYVAYEEPSTLVLFRKAEEDATIGKPAETLWTATASDVWVKENIKIAGKRDFTLHFMATHGKGKTYIAVDDLQFLLCESLGECQSNTDFQCADGSCIPRQQYCDADYNCADKSDEYQCPDIKGNCNFDSASWLEECSYRQRSDDDLDWQLASSSGQSATGPQHDHTLGSIGYYVYVASTSEDPGLLAILETKDEYPASQSICYIRLWHYMHTDFSAENVDIGTLRVYLSDKFNKRYLVASVSGNHDDQWVELVILVNMDLTYFVMFEAETGTSEHTYIAIDDVSFTRECETGVGPPPTNSTCDSGQQACASGQCVPEAFFCDCIVDCIDESDENNCSSTCITLSTRPTTSTTPNPSTRPTTSTTPNPSACSERQFSCEDTEQTCIPALLLCDSVPDCPNNSDETQCPENAHCDIGFFYCGDKYMSEHPCLMTNEVCDGTVNCNTYQADESVCGSCPENYCQNDGLCATDGKKKGERPTCNCSSEYTGNRCELPASPSTTNVPPTTPSGGLDAGTIAGIVLGVLLVIIIAAVGFVYFRTKRRVVEETQTSSWDVRDHEHYMGPDLQIPKSDNIPLENFDNTSVPEEISSPTVDL